MVNDQYNRQPFGYYEYYPQATNYPMYYNGYNRYYDQGYYDQGYYDQGYYYQPYMNQGYYPPRMNSVPPVQQPNYENSATSDGAVSNRMMQQFLDENGQVDVQKMLSTVGQLADTVQQVSPVIKQLNELIRNFRA